MEIRETEHFTRWLESLKDRQARMRIVTRIDRLAAGNPGQHRNLKGAISELKLSIGPGYRVYYTMRGDTLIILLCGGDKSTQRADIARAQRLAEQL